MAVRVFYVSMLCRGFPVFARTVPCCEFAGTNVKTQNYSARGVGDVAPHNIWYMNIIFAILEKRSFKSHKKYSMADENVVNFTNYS